jgi:hypothetical protein
MARAALLIALCSVMLLATASAARLTPDAGRSLLQTPDCSRIANW